MFSRVTVIVRENLGGAQARLYALSAIPFCGLADMAGFAKVTVELTCRVILRCLIQSESSALPPFNGETARKQDIQRAPPVRHALPYGFHVDTSKCQKF